MKMSPSIDPILVTRVVPAATLEHAEQAVPLAEALLAGGLDVIEVTMRTDCALEAIRRIAGRCPDMFVGAGTVLSGWDLNRAVEAGSRFGVAPGVDAETIGRATELSFPFFPGVATPTEVGTAIRMGCRLLKFFPAGAFGGTKMLTAMAGPFSHTGVKFLPTGGIDAANAREYLALPLVAAVGGSWMVKRELIAGRKWKEITRLAREAVAVCVKR